MVTSDKMQYLSIYPSDACFVFIRPLCCRTAILRLAELQKKKQQTNNRVEQKHNRTSAAVAVATTTTA